MEKNIERKTLSFSKGITNIPNDLLSDDSELLECIGFITKDGSLMPVQNPKKVTSIPYKLKYVHKTADYKNLIAYDEDSKKLYCYLFGENGISGSPDVQSFSLDSLLDVKSVGNTLVCATDEGLHYLLFKGGKYKDLGTELPKPKVEFETLATNLDLAKTTACDLKEIVDTTAKSAVYDADGNLFGISGITSDTTNVTIYTSYTVKSDAEKQTTFQTAIQGHIAARKQRLKEDNYFCYPFFVRYALKLFDGSYARISAPILVCPTINRNNYFVPVKWDEDKKQYVEGGWGIINIGFTPTYTFMWYPFYSSLWYKASLENMTNWEDIVKEIVVFASDDVAPFDVDGDFEFKIPTAVDGSCYANQVSGKPSPSATLPSWFTPASGSSSTIEYNYYYKFNYSSYKAREVIAPKKMKSDNEIMEELLGKSQFYKLFSIDVESDLNQQSFTVAPIKSHVVENLTVQEQLKVDDYYGWTSTTSQKMFAYNSRINLMSHKRKPYSGFSDFVSMVYGALSADTQEYDIYTHIVSDSMDAWVKASGIYTALPEMLGSWIYYPDPNATEMRIVKTGTTQGVSIKLKTHPMLNGSYYFSKLPFPRITQSDFTYSEIEIPTIDEDAHETLNSQIFTSVVNNPFVFEASGDNTVGTGTILGLAANTEAVSQGQFGQYPLMVFTSEGVYGMSVNSEGLYSATYPISREVCLDNSPLVPTDKLVYFTSKKGLMAASGGSVGCVSELLRGRTPMNFATLGDGKFLDFTSDCLIAYDYRDSMLRIFSKDKSYQYIYNMTDKTFSMVDSGITAQAVLNDYPDNLIQGTDGSVYSLTEKPDINDDEDSYSGIITTRPLKLGGSMTLKSLRKIKNLRETLNGKLSLEIWGSNNAKKWCKLNSILGKPWSYYTFKYTLSEFKACDSFSGTIVDIQNRRELK